MTPLIFQSKEALMMNNRLAVCRLLPLIFAMSGCSRPAAPQPGFPLCFTQHDTLYCDWN
jgi:hypothetical protein